MGVSTSSDLLVNSAGIYVVVNQIDQTGYIGSAKRLEARKRNHFGRGSSNIHLQRAIEKYGKENFTFEVLEHVGDLSQLIVREQFWIDRFLSEERRLYNATLTAGSCLGYKFGPPPQHVRDKIRSKLVGRKPNVHTCDILRRQSIERRASDNLIKWNLIHGNATKGKPSPLRGRPSPLRGRTKGPMPQATRDKLSIAMRNRTTGGQ